MAHVIYCNLCYYQAKKTKEEAAQMNAQILCAVSTALLYVCTCMLHNDHNHSLLMGLILYIMIFLFKGGMI